MTTQAQDQRSDHRQEGILERAGAQLDRLAMKLEDSTSDFEVCLGRMHTEAAAAGAELIRFAEIGVLPTDQTTPWRYHTLQTHCLDGQSDTAGLPLVPAHDTAECYYAWNQLSAKAAAALREQIRQFVARQHKHSRAALAARVKGIDQCLGEASKRRRSRVALEETPDAWLKSWRSLHDLVVGTIRSGEFPAIEPGHPTWDYLERYARQPFFSFFGHPEIVSSRPAPPMAFELLVENMAQLHDKDAFVDPNAYRDRHVLIEHSLAPDGSSGAPRMTPWTVEVASFGPAVPEERMEWSCDHGLSRRTAALLAAQLGKVCRDLATTLVARKQSGSAGSTNDGEWRVPGWFAAIRNSGLTVSTLKKARHREQVKARPAGSGRFELLVSSVVARYPKAADAIRRQLEQEAR